MKKFTPQRMARTTEREPMTGADRTRLAQLLGMTGSAHDGEALNALRFAQKLMKEAGITWEDTLHGNGLLTYREGFQEGYEQGHEEGYAKGLREGKALPRTRPGSWRALARDMLADHLDELTSWENEFVSSFFNRGWHTPSDRQRSVFEKIAGKLSLELPD